MNYSPSAGYEHRAYRLDLRANYLAGGTRTGAPRAYQRALTVCLGAYVAHGCDVQALSLVNAEFLI